MARPKKDCWKDLELILGCGVREAPDDHVLALLILGIFDLARERAERRLTRKRAGNHKRKKVARLLYLEVLRRMRKTKTA